MSSSPSTVVATPTMSNSSSSNSTLTPEQRKERERSIALHMTLLRHASTCRSTTCTSANCAKMKGLLKHGAGCEIKVNGGCKICKRIWALLQIHARQCKADNCSVPNCMVIREHFRKLPLQQQAMDDMHRQMMNVVITKPNTAHESISEETNLHPAADIFLREVLSDIRNENKSLNESVSRLHHLLEYIGNVKVSAATNEEPIIYVQGEDGIHRPGVPEERSTIAEVSVNSGSIVNWGDKKVLRFFITSSHQILAQNLGSLGGVGIKILGDHMFFPPHPRSSDRLGQTNVEVNDDGAVKLTLIVEDKFLVRGNLIGMSEDDILNFADGTYAENRLDSSLALPLPPLGDGWRCCPDFSAPDADGKFVTYNPTMVGVVLNSSLTRKMGLIDDFMVTKNPNVLDSGAVSPSQELRYLTAEAFGNKEDKDMFINNRRLKLQSNALLNIQAFCSKSPSCTV